MSENKDKVEKVLEKVKKLLALSGNNPSEEEAKSAALKAQQLMAEYNLSVSDIDGEEKLEMTDAGFSTGTDNNWKFSLSRVVADNFRCEVYWVGKKRVVFYGYKADCEIARDVFEFLFKTCKKRTTQVADKAYAETGSSKGVRYSYSSGFVAGIKEVLDKQCTSLMIVTPPEVKESFTEMCYSEGFKTINTSRRDAVAGSKLQNAKQYYNQGIQDGRSAMNGRSIESRK